MLKKIKVKIGSDKHFSELLKGSYISFLMKMMGMLFGYIFTFMIAKWYGADVFGMFTLSLTVLNIFVTIGLLGFDNALVKFVADYNINNNHSLVKEVYDKALGVTLPISIFLSFLLFIQADFVAINIFKNPHLVSFFQIASFAIVPFVLLRINSSMFRGLKKIIEFSFFQNVSIYFVGVILLCIAFLLDEVNELTIIAIVISIFLSSLISFVYLKRNIRFLKVKNTMLSYNNIFKTTLPMLLTSSMVLVMGWTDIIMLGMLTTEKDVGIYSVIVKLASLTSITLMAINSISAPKFSELYSKGDMKGLKKVVHSSTKMIFYSSLPIILILVLFPTDILRLFGEDYVVGFTALLILMSGQFVNAVTGPVGNLLNMTNYQNIYKNIMYVSIVVNICFNYIFIIRYGIVGAAVATSISVVLLNLFSAFFVYKKLNINIWKA